MLNPKIEQLFINSMKEHAERNQAECINLIYKEIYHRNIVCGESLGILNLVI